MLWVSLSGAKVEERALGVDVVAGILLGESPPKISRSYELLSWLVRPATYSAVRRCQTDHLQQLQEWWRRTWRVCPLDRVRVHTGQACNLCGDVDLRLGCPTRGSHVCLSCHRLADAGWPGGTLGSRREQLRKNISLRGRMEVVSKLEHLVSRLEPLHCGPYFPFPPPPPPPPTAVLALIFFVFWFLFFCFFC